MLYQDTVESEALVHTMVHCLDLWRRVRDLSYVQPCGHNLWRAYAIGHRRPTTERRGRFAIAFVIAVMFCVNIVLIGFAPLKAQIGIAWVELLLLLLAYFKAFNLSMPFI